MMMMMMALRSIPVSNHNQPHSSQALTICHSKPKVQFNAMAPKLQQSTMKRRLAMIAITMASSLFIKEAEFAYGVDLRMVAPEQTLEEAETGIESHAKALLQVKDLIESKSWREAQKELRKSSSLLKQDIYTIIQGKPGSERPQLRKLYSNLFNTVTKLDYAAREQDELQVSQCYDKVVLALNDILTKL